MRLIIAEKEQLGRQISAAIDGPEKTGGSCIYKGDYCITWASGHLLTLKEPQDYDPALAKWSLAALPIFFEHWEVKPKDDRTKKRLDAICSLIAKASCIINAGDPDEEGQLIVDEILRYCRNTKPVYRLATGDTTVPALKKALVNLKPNKDFEDGGWSAYARSVADMTFGINMSRYFTLNNQPATLTIGRVQSPTLGLVVARDAQIENHVKTYYYVVSAGLEIDGVLVPCKYEPDKEDPNLTDGKILNESYAHSRVMMLDNERFQGIKITKRMVEEQPPLPLDLVELQTYCGSRFGYKPDEVMEITQTLRTKYDCISYNRSKCRYLSDNHFDEAPDTMATVARNIGGKPKGLDLSIRSRCFNSAKVDAAAHFAIIPQNVAVDISSMAERERNVYLAVVKYYMAQFMPPAKKRITKLEVTTPDNGRLVSSVTEIVEKGYRTLFAKDKKDEQENEQNPLFGFAAGQYVGNVRDARYDRKETKPPSRYTQTSLNKDMTSISKYVDDPEVKALLLKKDKGEDGENGSIGTVATRSGIITDLIKRGFLEDDGKHVISTPLGRELIRILPNEAKKPDLTAYWWAIQEDIRAGKQGYTFLTDNVLAMVKKFLHTEYPAIDQSAVPDSLKRRAGNGAFGKESLGACPRCGRPVIEGKYGYGCSGWKDGCKFTIWRNPKSPVMKDVTFSAEDARKFLAGKKVLKKNLNSPRTGGNFDAYLIMVDDPSKPFSPMFNFSFPKKRKKKT